MKADINIENTNTWIELSKSALLNNIKLFRNLIGPKRKLCAVVKANGYGHGMVHAASVAVEGGVDWLAVFQVNEGIALRNQGIQCPILVLGPAREEQLVHARKAQLRLTLGSMEAVKQYCKIENQRGSIPCHLKLETGTNRQGLTQTELYDAIGHLKSAHIEIEGAYTHYADIEDTTEHDFATSQLERFSRMLTAIRETGNPVPLPHTACTAAAILFPKTYFEMVRVGIGLYGLWPSKETHVSAGMLGRNELPLLPVMTWKTRVAQTKTVPAGDFVGYGRTFRATRDTRLAILPVGYADGYSRGLSSRAHTIIKGIRAPVVGRICMNLTMVDVTDVPGVSAGDNVILMGKEGDETVSAEDLAALDGTINYEIVTRAAPGAPRIVV